MSTVIPTTRDPKASADPRVLHPLDRLRGTIRRFVVLDGLLAAGLFVVVWFWLALAADYGLFRASGFDWVQDAPWALRALALVAAAAALAAVVVTRIAVRLTREFSYPSLALVLEKRFPGVLGDRLITAVELADVAERDLLLRDTPWPRRAHLEVLDFPADGLRVGKDAPPPKVRVRAYEWVVADRSAKDGTQAIGWRPLRWEEIASRGWAADVP